MDEKPAEPALDTVRAGDGCGGSASSSSRLTQPIGSSGDLRPGGFSAATLAPVATEDLEVRIALIFHDVLDVQSADAASYEKIQPEATQAITQFLVNQTRISSPLSHTSVGTGPALTKGARHSRRTWGSSISGRSLRASLIFRLVRLLITADDRKNKLVKESVSLHCDDMDAC